MAVRSSETELIGRAAATHTIDRLLDGVAAGGGAVIVRGEAGVGKTALLSVARTSAEARDMQVISASGVPSEMHVAFAGLSQLLRPVLSSHELALDPDSALQVALGSATGPTPELFRIALATLDLLAARAAQRPLLIIADDVQWFDPETADALAFVSWRISNDPIVLVAAARDGWASVFDDSSFPELVLEPLDDPSAQALVDRRAPGLAPWARARVLAAAAGNPLALVELPSTAERLPGDPLAPMPLNERLEKAFGARFRDLPAPTRSLLLLCALHDSSNLDEILGAAQQAEDRVSLDDVTAAEEAALVELDTHRMRFRHPLMRAAVLQASTTARRISAHRMLATALAAEPDRAVWHRAASTLGPDAEIAAELDEAAARSQRRGAVEAATLALERAAQLSDNRDDRNRRMLQAAVLALDLGRPVVAQRRIDQVPTADLSPIDAARRALVHEAIHPSLPDDEKAALSLVDHADRARSDGEEDLALELLWIAANSGFWADRPDRSGQRILRSLSDFRPEDDDPRILSVITYAAPIERGSIVLDRIGRITFEPASDPKLTGLFANAAVTLGALDLAIPFMDAAVEGLRQQGRLAQLAQTLVLRGWASIQLGRREVAESDAAEAISLASETRQPIWEGAGRVIEAMVLGYRGDVDQAVSLLAEAEGVGLHAGRALLNVVQLARGAVALSNGRAGEAYDALFRMLDPRDPSYHRVESCWAIGLLADSAVSSGKQSEVRPVLGRLEPLAEQTSSPWFQISMRHARAVLAQPDDADRLFRAALAADLSRWPVDWARLQLAYGKYLRRGRRVSESRAALRAARDSFDALGLVAWGQRAREELRTAGESSGPRVAQVSEHLTPQELQIARLAADGLSNREIADRLFLSHRTVGSHLYRIFPKLGITERGQVADALQRTTQDG